VVDADGSVTMVTSTDDSKDTALSHTPRTPPLSAALGAFNDPLAQVSADMNGDGAGADGGDAGADENNLDLTMKKKKKKKVPKDEGDAEDAAADTAAADAPADAPADVPADGALDLTLKKKKKKKVTKEGEADDFAAKLKALDLDSKEEAEEEAAATVEDEGDMDTGTGLWEHNETRIMPYSLLLKRFYKRLEEKNPDHALSGTKSYKIPPPQCMREGNKKTIFANIAEICKRMKRTDEHVTAYLFAELGTSGSVDGSRRLVIKGRFQQKQIENVLRKYIRKFSSFHLPQEDLLIDCVQSSTSPARPADRRIPSLAKEKTASTSLPAILAVRDDLLRLSRPVSLHRSARERRCRANSSALSCFLCVGQRRLALDCMEYFIDHNRQRGIKFFLSQDRTSLMLSVYMFRVFLSVARVSIIKFYQVTGNIAIPQTRICTSLNVSRLC
jgi:translation initiation factor 2 subunit 2